LIIETEALAAVSAVKEFYPYLYSFHFTLLTDHNLLTSLKGMKEVGGRLIRWILFLQQFNFEFKYRPGKMLQNADTMSRIASVISNCSSSLGSISEAQLKDDQLSQAIKALQKGESLPQKMAPGLRRTFLHDGVLYCHFRQSSMSPCAAQLVVPTSMRDTVLTQLHNQAGHLGIHKTLEKVKERFYWPGYEADVENWVRSCQSCQKRNPPQPAPQAPMGTIQAHHPFEKISWDIMGPLPTSSKGHKYIVLITDLFSKWVEAFPLRVTDSETLARVLVDEIVCRYGVPTYLHSDQGSNLNSEVITTLCKQLGIDRTRTTAYHPQANGQVERFNRTLEAMLSKVVNENQRDWDSHLPKVLFAYRTSIHESTGFTPFLVNYGRSAMLPVDVMLGRASTSLEGGKGLPEYVEQVGQSLKQVYDKLRHSIEEAHKANKARYDKRESGCNFTVGDLVWLYVPAVKTGCTKKLSCLWRGPYTIVDKTSAVNYRIQLVGSAKTTIVHRNRLKTCYGRPQLKASTRTNGVSVCNGEHSERTDTVSKGVSTDPQTTRSYAEVTATTPNSSTVTTPSSSTAGYTSTDGIGTTSTDGVGTSSRPQRTRRPPDFYRP